MFLTSQCQKLVIVDAVNDANYFNKVFPILMIETKRILRFRMAQFLFVEIEFLTSTIIFLYFVKKCDISMANKSSRLRTFSSF